jgi:L-histidine N-alpha-methyltransferase
MTRIAYASPATQDPAAALAAMAQEVRLGLTAKEPSLPSKYFYDDVGGGLFEEITRLPEYYLTRTEESLLVTIADTVVDRVRPRELVELGSGTSRKVRLLLDAMRRAGLLEGCVLLDINEAALESSLESLTRAYPGLEARGIVGDFINDLGSLGPGGGRLLAFLGSTIGNLYPDELPSFFRSAAQILAPGDGLLLGLDLVKDRRRLEAAYNDATGITARFNLNILRVVNERLGADFDPGAFEHVAFYDDAQAWIEMRLRARGENRVHVAAAGLDLHFRAGDEIRTEISCKYTRESLLKRLPAEALRLEEWFTDPEDLFALALLRRHETPS